jgi:hypothetical protein
MAERVTVTVRDAVTLALEDWQVEGEGVSDTEAQAEVEKVAG